MVILLALLGCPGGGGTEKSTDTAAPVNPDSAETGGTDTGPDPNELDADGDGFTPNTGDCDDTRGHVYPGAPDYCDGLDADCDGEPIPDGSCGEAGDPAAMWSWSIEGTKLVEGDDIVRLGDVTGDGATDLGVRVLSLAEPFEIYNYALSGTEVTSRAPRREWDAYGWAADSPRWHLEWPFPAGDVNGDGMADVWEMTNVSSGQYVGAAFLFLGRPGGWGTDTARVDLAADAVWLPEGGVAFVTGGSYGGAGEVNGDGFADRIVYTNGATGEVRWTLIEGSASPTGAHSLGELESIDLDFADLGAGAGYLVGDLDGDGLSDGAWRSGSYETPSQIVYLSGSDWTDGAHLADLAAVAWDGTPTVGYGLYLAEGTNPAAPADLDQDGLEDGLLQVHRSDERYCMLVTSGGIPDGDVNAWVTVSVCSEEPESTVTPYEWIDDIDDDGSTDVDLGGWGVNAVPSSELASGGTFDVEDLQRFRASAAGFQSLRFTSDLNGDGLPEWVLEDGYWPEGDETLGRTLIIEGFAIPWEDESKW